MIHPCLLKVRHKFFGITCTYLLPPYYGDIQFFIDTNLVDIVK